MKSLRYKVICPICGNRFDVAKSIFMDMGINTGSCNCPKCNTMLHLECEDDTKSMKAVDYKLYVEKKREERNQEDA